MFRVGLVGVSNHTKRFLAIVFLLGLALLVNFGFAGIEWVRWQGENNSLNDVSKHLKEIDDHLNTLQSSVAQLAFAPPKADPAPINSLAVSPIPQTPVGAELSKVTPTKTVAKIANDNGKSAPNKVAQTPAAAIPP